MEDIEDIVEDVNVMDSDDFTPDFTIDGKDMWEHYHVVAEKSHFIPGYSR